MREKMLRATHIFGVLGCLLMLMVVGRVQATPIPVDTFSQDQFFTWNGVVGSMKTDKEIEDTLNFPGSVILGGTRASTIKITARPGFVGQKVVKVSEGGNIMSLSNDTGFDSEMMFTWDADGAGLGGVDLTDGGINKGFGFKVLFADQNMDLKFTVIDNTLSMNTGSLTLSTPVGGISETQQIFFPFVNFSGSVDFTQVKSIQLTVDGPPAWDADIDFVGAVVPEPSTLILLGVGVLGVVGYSWRHRKPSA